MDADQLSRVSDSAFTAALVGYSIAMAGYFHYLAFRREPVWVAARAVAVVALVAHVASIVARGLAADRVPWGNMYEYSSALAALVVAAYLTIVEWRSKVRTLGGFALGFAVVTMAVARMQFYVVPAPLQPALNSYWIRIHVIAAIVGSSLLALGSLFTILYLFQDRRERRRAAHEEAVREELAARDPAPILGGSVDADPPYYLPGADEPVASRTVRRGRLPAAATIDRLAYRTIAIGFPIWTFAIIAGAIWAEQAWGRYWGWDPKETWAFITWVIFAGYLHARATSGWKGRRAAVLALVGFASLMVTYYAVNLFIVGLHSYRGF